MCAALGADIVPDHVVLTFDVPSDSKWQVPPSYELGRRPFIGPFGVEEEEYVRERLTASDLARLAASGSMYT